jgi:hypothetical protein
MTGGAVEGSRPTPVFRDRIRIIRSRNEARETVPSQKFYFFIVPKIISKKL